MDEQWQEEDDRQQEQQRDNEEYQEFIEFTNLQTKGLNHEHINTNTRAIRDWQKYKSAQYESRKHITDSSSKETASVPF